MFKRAEPHGTQADPQGTHPGRVEYTPEELAAYAHASPDELLSGHAPKPKEPPQNPTSAGSPSGPDVSATATGSSGAADASTADAKGKLERQFTRYEYIENTLRGKENTARLALALGYDGKDERGKAEAFKYISNVLMEIQKTECAPSERDDKKLKRDLTFCSPESIVSAIIDAANFRLPIDGRKLAYLVRYGETASFQPGYKGILFKISELYRDVDFTAEPVFQDDELELSDEGGYQTYTHKRVNPFQADVAKMIGLIACMAYTTESGRHSKVATLPKSEIDLIRSKAKQDYIWKEWYFEKAKAAGLKRLCKIHFASAMGLQELLQYDNEKHFEIETPNGDKITPANSGEVLSNLLEHKPAVTMPTIEPARAEAESVPVGVAAQSAASRATEKGGAA